MENVNVYSPIEDKQIKATMGESPIWKKSYTEEEFNENPNRYPIWYKYMFKFKGMDPIQLRKVQKIVKNK